ncbi:hypothetical protein PVW48_19610 [Dinoroseobacter sp. PD6]|uniref:hypothetical protein n=1 Tax=Dinoroseobacter sp. PD6 TaxID=3028384 RepID=UPI00237B6145|nr:hypothetical protein [Dinoroseobacter sp. PD6]MDD9718972.1 hypothetical protein [Dinoroseobacter sp. PD6]
MGDIFNGIAAIAQLGMFAVVAFGAWIAWRQLHSWRDERLSLRLQELAEEIVALTSELADRISEIRSVMGYGPPAGEEDDGTYDYRRRLKELAELDSDFLELRRLRSRTKVLVHSEPLLDAIDAFFEVRSKVALGLRSRIRTVLRENGGQSMTEAEQKRIHRDDGVIWEGDFEDDEIVRTLSTSLKTIETELSPIVRFEIRRIDRTTI